MSTPTDTESLRTIDMFGMPLADIDTAGLLDHMFERMRVGEGGWIVTANLDILRRYVLDPESRSLYAQSDIIVADGMPLVWASQLRKEPLPERVAGSSLSVDLLGRAAAEGRSIYLLGGKGDVADRARDVATQQHPGLNILGTNAPFISSPITDDETQAIVDEIEATGQTPDIILVGFGSPKQEHAIAALRARFPSAWFIGIGITFSFICGETQRAPEWMQRTGLEWMHRMVQEPGRLTRRYLKDDLPFFGLLMLESFRQGRDD
ncbi:MAG: WecB/TagA/CpsF family glycosyltransferase [Myxococcota bacterium]